MWPHTFVSASADSRGAVVSYWRKYVYEVLVSRIGGLGLPRKSVVRLTDRADMTLDVYRGRETITQQQQEETEKMLRHTFSTYTKTEVFYKTFCPKSEAPFSSP